jgi:hypothetical protein
MGTLRQQNRSADVETQYIALKVTSNPRQCIWNRAQTRLSACGFDGLCFTRLYIPCPAGGPWAAVNNDKTHDKGMTMVSKIGGASLAQSLLARVESRKAQETAEVAIPASSADETSPSAASPRSAQTEAAARVGAQLDAQFDASRLQRPQGEAPAEDAPAIDEAAAPAASTASASGTEAAEDTSASVAAAPAAAGGAPAGAAASSSAETDYIAEADTNNDRKVSEQERIAYAKKQASEAEKAASQPDAPAERSRAQEVQQAYLPQESTGAQLDIEA